MTSADLSIILPELLLAVYAMVALLLGACFGQDKLTPVLTWSTVVAFVVLALLVGLGEGSTRQAFGGTFLDDPYSRFAKVTLMLSAAAILAMSQDYMRRRDLGRFEFPVLVTLAVIGMMVMVSANDLMTLYMGLELQSLALYVVAALRRDSIKSTEAGLKYFVLGALSSGMLLYGASLTYGFSGTTEFAGITQAIGGAEHLPLGLLLGLTFLIAGLAFKVSAVPFHMWTPDVYEGAPTPVTAFFATAPKVAAMALFARLVFAAFGDVIPDWSQIVALLSVLSLIVGSVAAVGQTNIKRLMAYSSITHMGFALMGLAAGTVYGVQQMLLYLAIYVTMNVGTFAFILSMTREGQPVADLKCLNKYSTREPAKAFALLLLMFSLAGVPPMLGFFAKYGVLTAAMDANMAWLTIIGVLASVVSAFYYLRIVFYMYFGIETEDELDRGMPAAQWAVLMGSAAIMLIGVFNLFGVEGAASAAAAALVP